MYEHTSGIWCAGGSCVLVLSGDWYPGCHNLNRIHGHSLPGAQVRSLHMNNEYSLKGKHTLWSQTFTYFSFLFSIFWCMKLNSLKKKHFAISKKQTDMKAVIISVQCAGSGVVEHVDRAATWWRASSRRRTCWPRRRPAAPPRRATSSPSRNKEIFHNIIINP